MAGNSDFKRKFCENLDPILKKKVIKVMDISCVGENGLNEAITLASEALS